MITETRLIGETIKQVCKDSAKTQDRTVQAKTDACILSAQDSVSSESLHMREIDSALERGIWLVATDGEEYNNRPDWAQRTPTDGLNVEIIAANVLQHAGWVAHRSES